MLPLLHGDRCLSDVLWLPLVIGIILSFLIARRTRDRVQLKATIAFGILVIVFAVLYLSDLASQFVGRQVVASGVGLTDAIGYVFGEGWLSTVVLTSMIVNGLRRWTGTLIWESKVLADILDIIVLAGFGWLLWSFATGHPSRVFG